MVPDDFDGAHGISREWRTEMTKGNGKARKEGRDARCGDVPGIVIADGRCGAAGSRRAPRIQAFVWGGKVQPSPTLPYGRWKGAA